MTAIATTEARAIGEKRASVASRRRVRSGGSSRRVAAGSASSRKATPPTQTLAASTWMKSDGNITAIGLSMLAWPAKAGVLAR